MKWCLVFCCLCGVLTTMCEAVLPLPQPKTSYTYESILLMTANELVGLPLSIAIGVLNGLCLPFLGGPELPIRPAVEPGRIKFHLMTPCKNYSVNILDAIELVALLDPLKKTWLHIPGFNTDIVISTDIGTLWRQFACRDNEYQFISLDMANYMQTDYVSAIRNLEDISEYVAEGLAILFNNNVLDRSQFILSGHSLGAHHSGLVARHIRTLTGTSLPMVIGLDPARPCFDSQYSNIALSASDATFVAVIHGNNGILGMRNPIGTCDFYPDRDKSFPAGSMTVVEAHDIPVIMLAETLVHGNGHNFPSYECSSLTAMQLGICSATSTNYMGLLVDRTKSGIFYVPTNFVSPYGSTPNTRTPFWLESMCHICDE